MRSSKFISYLGSRWKFESLFLGVCWCWKEWFDIYLKKSGDCESFVERTRGEIEEKRGIDVVLGENIIRRGRVRKSKKSG